MDLKIVLSIIAVLLTFAGYIPYIRDTWRGKTMPHVFTWFLWGVATVIGYGLQVQAGAGVGSWVTLAVAVACFLIFVLGLRNGKKNIVKADVIFFVLAIIVLFLWLFAKQPVLAAILNSSAAVLGFIPTVRKSWNKPYSETLFSYELNVVRHGLAFLALEQYNIITWLYPVTWVFMNGFFSIYLIIRRKQAGK